MPKSVPFRIKLRSGSRNSTHGIQDNVVSSTISSGPPSPAAGSSLKVKPSTLVMRRKRELLKQDPVAWAEYKASEAERQRLRRRNRTEEQKLKDREAGKAKSAKYYLKKRGLGEQNPPAEKSYPKPQMVVCVSENIGN